MSERSPGGCSLVDRSRIFCAASSLYFKLGDEASVQRQVAFSLADHGTSSFHRANAQARWSLCAIETETKNKKHCSVSLDATSLLKMYAAACENHNSTAVNLTHI